MAEPDPAQADVPSDHELVRRVAQRDREALAVLVRRHQEKVLGLAMRFLGRTDLAEDVCQEAFIKVWDNAASYRPTAKFTTWLYRVVSNLCWDQRRKAARNPGSLETARLSPEEAGSDEALVRREREEQVRRAVAQLPERQQLALVLHRFQGLSHGEIADATGWSIGAVESCLVRAYGRLRELLLPLRET